MKTGRCRLAGRRAGGRLGLWLLALFLPATVMAANHPAEIVGPFVYEVDGQGGKFTLTVSRVDGGQGRLFVRVVAQGVDYVVVDRDLAWEDGDTSVKAIPVTIKPPRTRQDRTFTVFLYQVDRQARAATGTLIDQREITVKPLQPGTGSSQLRTEAVAGNFQQGQAEDVLDPFVLRVTDANGNPFADAVVAWSVSPPEGGKLQAAETPLDAQGESRNVLSLNSDQPLSVTATVLVDAVVLATQHFVINGNLTDSAGLTDNQRAVEQTLVAACAALDDLGQARSPEQDDLLATCQALRAAATPTALAAGLDALAPAEVAAQRQLIIDGAKLRIASLFQRLASLRAGDRGVDLEGVAVSIAGQRLPSAVLASLFGGSARGGSAGTERADIASPWGLFLNADVLLGERERSGYGAGYDIGGNGFTAGVDYRFSNALVLGGALGYNQDESRFEQNGGETELGTYHGALYGSFYTVGNFFLDGLVRVGRNDIETLRRLSPPGTMVRGRTRGWEYAAGLSGGFDFSRNAFSVSPYGRLGYIRSDIDAYVETGPGIGSVLAIDRQETTSVTAVLGGRMSYAISAGSGVYLLQMSGEWEREFRDRNGTISARFFYDPNRTSFNILTDRPDKGYFNLGLGISAMFAGGRSAFLHYETRLGQEYVTLNWINLGVRFEL